MDWTDKETSDDFEIPAWRAAYRQVVPKSVRRTIRKPLDSKLVQEMLVYSNLLAFWSDVPRTRFVLFAQGRTGSELLVDLLNSSPQIYCEGEIFLNRKVLFPRLFIEGCCARSKRSVYGFKVKIYQLTKDQGVKDVKRFMTDLHDEGWRIIYLQRKNILRQALSYLRGVHRNSFLSDGSRIGKIPVDCDRLIELLDERAVRLKNEAEVLRDLPHVRVIYENDLLTGDHHQRTVDRLFDYLGVPRVQVETKLRRTSSDRLSDMIENYAQVSDVIGRTEYAEFLE
jgi:hypothetical protein